MPALANIHAAMKSIPFTLLDKNRLPRPPTPEERQTLGRLFPGQRGLCVLGPFLIITVESLPLEPWPACIAGLPLYLTCTDFEVPWELGIPGNPRVQELEQLNAKSRPTRVLYDAVIQHFEERNIDIHELVWIAGSWRVSVSGTPTEVLPGKVCQVTVFYVIKEPATLPQASIFRSKDPHNTIDDSSYSGLRPGIMVASKSLTTTSWVAVNNSAGEAFMTVASHGFPSGQIDVHHPRDTDPVIGRVEQRMTIRISRWLNYPPE